MIYTNVPAHQIFKNIKSKVCNIYTESNFGLVIFLCDYLHLQTTFSDKLTLDSLWSSYVLYKRAQGACQEPSYIIEYHHDSALQQISRT